MNGNILARSNLMANGNYLYLAGGSGTVNSSGGPFIYADNNWIIPHVGSGNYGFAIQNSSGTTISQFTTNGGNSYINGTGGGNVGIGTTKSGASLEIAKNNYPTLRINDTSAANRQWDLTASKSNFGDFEISNYVGTKLRHQFLRQRRHRNDESGIST